MRSVNKICMSVLMLGAAAIAAPAVAQEGQAAQSEQAAAPDQAAAAASTKSDAKADTSAGPAAASSQTAMNSGASGAVEAANASVSSVGDTAKKYHRSSRTHDFAAEQKITQQLNQQAAAAAKPNVQTAANQ